VAEEEGVGELGLLSEGEEKEEEAEEGKTEARRARSASDCTSMDLNMLGRMTWR
jgi:hypothetical protein